MTDIHALAAELSEGRARFLALVENVRPELHRYCARMTGSVADGEDIVQETLARAYYAFPELKTVPPLRPWLFKIAHGRAIDHLRRYERKMGAPLETVLDSATDAALDPEDAVARSEAVQLAVSRFVELPPAQRSAVILKDVLGHSIEEICELLDVSEPAVKAALHRGRTRLKALTSAAEQLEPARATSLDVARYARLFNERDWDGVRAMLAEDVRLDLVGRSRRTGRRDVGGYVDNYSALHDWHFVPAWLGGREVLAVFRDPADPSPGYFVELAFEEGKVTSIHDFRYVPYIAREAVLVIAR
ncbi:RNA polymerase sigma-54 factor RpoN [Labilithrix luteola]|uniref:RNA polymerase sigma-54 factor RpoN n=1 Tax=Labilithrix luteola TaxID=1391654 RepID=A0A0K1Q7M8_9BACT|nr:sigma-70 family RNA polymerase sigma factor [Labilithrix luteola]AKV01415.1 RNA polymerase sigma-54 factor RpoN [Labilithrix luteola]